MGKENYLPPDFRYEVVEKLGINMNVCPDQLICKIENGLLGPENRKNIDYGKKCRKDVIVIVLESPHKSEYSDGGKPLGPARGTTGALFRKKFSSILEKSESSLLGSIEANDYEIAFLNSVQYQCSLGESLQKRENKIRRDENFLKCLKAGCGEDLCRRLEHLKPKIVINLCTHGYRNLQLEVDLYLREFCKKRGYVYVLGSHPSTWNFGYAYIE